MPKTFVQDSAGNAPVNVSTAPTVRWSIRFAKFELVEDRNAAPIMHMG
jgi:hypothetical protein